MIGIFQNGVPVLPTAKEVTVQPSNSFVLSKSYVKQTKAQVIDSNSGLFGQTCSDMSRLVQTLIWLFNDSISGSTSTINSNYSVIKPQMKDDRMLEEYMNKLNFLEEKKAAILSNNNNKKPVLGNQTKKSGSSDNVLANEFMRVREEKFGKVIQSNEQNEVARENQKNLARSSNQQNCKFY